MSDELLNRIAELEGELAEEQRRARVQKHFYDTHKDGGVKDKELALMRADLVRECEVVARLQNENRRLRLLMKKARCEAAIQKTRQTIRRIDEELNKA